LRVRQAAETRQNVLAAATGLFVERGWAATTLAAVAAEAGTAIETVYSAFGSKSGLLIAAIDVAIVGDDDDTPLVERAEFAALGAGKRSERLMTAARIITRALVHAVPLMGALQEASASDAASKVRWQAYETDRRIVISAGLGRILGKRPPEILVDSIWALASRGLRQTHRRSRLDGGALRGVAGPNGRRSSPSSGGLSCQTPSAATRT
jgi:AcrR family transcriptional regulator